MKLEIDDTALSTINAILNPVILTDGQNIQSANSAFWELVGVASTQEFNTRFTSVAKLFVKHNNFFAPSDIDTDETWTDYLFNNTAIKRIVSLHNNKDELRDFELTLKKIENQKEYLIVLNDITSYISEKNEYEYFAYHDHLTKIYNRQKFDELFLKAIENKKRYGDHLGIIMIDLDHFKKVNDTYGHLVGDLVLILFVNMVKIKLRTNDIFARWGGEEFVILLPRTTLDATFLKAKELRSMIESHLDAKLPQFTVSIGVTEINDADTINSALKRVDDALFIAKEERNEVAKL